jgi:flagellar hook protein FlgE
MMSFAIGLTGLLSSNEELAVISNNIANANTAGYKSSQVDFSAVYSGGVAGGVEIANVSQDFEKDGGFVSTGDNLDLAISGNGFFAMERQNGKIAYTRAGSFEVDADYRIVSSITGFQLQGYGVNGSGQLTQGVIGGLQLGLANLPAQASTDADIAANLNADVEVIDTTLPAYTFDPADLETYHYSLSTPVYDSLGAEHTLTQYYVKNAGNQWEVNYYMDDAPVTAPGGGNQVQTVTFDTSGRVTSPVVPVVVNFTPSDAEPMSLSINLANMTQTVSPFFAARNESNGHSAAALVGVDVDESGNVYGQYENGEKKLQGQVVLANFAANTQLESGNGTVWYPTSESGAPIFGSAGDGSLGTLKPGGVEGSNTDLTVSLVKLMSVQRNYQASAQILSKSNELQQTLFNSL